MANDLTAAPPAALTPADMLKIAVDQGADLDKLEKFMELARRWDEDQARKAFNEAVANFKANAPRLVKSADGNFGKYADLDSITSKLTPALARWGLSHSWAMAQEGERVAVTCRLAHVGGHSEEVSLSAPPDTGPGRNAIQALKSSTTYLCRITLLGVTGMATGVEATMTGRRPMATGLSPPSRRSASSPCNSRSPSAWTAPSSTSPRGC